MEQGTETSWERRRCAFGSEARGLEPVRPFTWYWVRPQTFIGVTRRHPTALDIDDFDDHQTQGYQEGEGGEGGV